MKRTIRQSFRVTSFAILVVLMAGVASAGDIEVIFSEAPGHATALVPGAKDLNGDPIVTEFKAFEDLIVSPDGTQWIIKSRNTAGSDLETMMLLGSDASGAMLAQEGQPVDGGVVGELYDFFDPVAGFNDSGDFAFGARARGGDSTIKEKVIKFDGSFSVVIQESDAALGLSDLLPNPSGDELFGNSLNSIHLLNDGSVGFVAVTIQNVHSSRRPAIFYDDTAFAQSGVTAIGGGTWDSFDSNAFFTTPDGSHWSALGDDEGDTATDDIFTVDGIVELREGSVIPSTAIVVTGIFDTKLLANGDWYCRGDDPSDDDWAVRSGTLVAATGDPIFEGATENWGDIFLAFTGNQIGHTILVGNTDNADPASDTVVVFNSEAVVIREGDPVDLDGNGSFDDDAFIGRGDNSLSAFSPNDFFLTDDRMLYFFAPLRDGAGQDLGTFGAGGEAFMRVQLPPSCAFGNVNLVAAGEPEDTLFINGSSGGTCRTVRVGVGESITVSQNAASGGPGANARFVTWAWQGDGVNPTILSAQGGPVGCSVNPTPVNGALIPQPQFCIPGQGIPAAACAGASTLNFANFAPWSQTKPNGLANPIQLILQGVLEDDTSSHPGGFSMTNAVTLIVE